MNQNSERKVFTFPNIAIGLVLEALLMMLLMVKDPLGVGGGPWGGLVVFFASIICTAGVSLVIWVPLAAGLGFMVTSLFREKKLEIPQRPNLAARRREVLRQYIEQAFLRGMKRDNAISLLRKNGWKESEIERALATIAGAGP
jgi:hypothetical protein